MSNINEYDFTKELEEILDDLRVETDCMHADAFSFVVTDRKQSVILNKYARNIDRVLDRLEELSDAATASYHLYESEMDKIAADREFEESIGDPNGLRNDDGQAVS